MLKFSSPPNSEKKQCTPNLLPCRVHHDGPVEASTRYWAPENGDDGKLEAYFRGRKLKGREVKVPEGYQGVIVQDAGKERKPKEDKVRAMMQECEAGEEEQDEDQEELGLLEEMGSFENIVVWGHESVAGNEDPFVRGMIEWISFAEVMHQPGKSHERPDK